MALDGARTVIGLHHAILKHCGEVVWNTDQIYSNDTDPE